MHRVGQKEHKTKGIWKIGEKHVKDIRKKHKENELSYNLLSMDEFKGIQKKLKTSFSIDNDI